MARGRCAGGNTVSAIAERAVARGDDGSAIAERLVRRSNARSAIRSPAVARLRRRGGRVEGMRRELTSALLLSCVIACAVASVSVAQAPEPPSCPRPGFTLQLMTPAAGYLPRDGALVAGLFLGGPVVSGDPPAGVALTRGRRSVAVRSETIAPGLFRLVPETTRLSGRYDLTGVATTPQLYFRRAPLAAPPTVPALERIERYLVAGADGRHLELRAQFAFPIPEGVVAVLSYFGDGDTPDAFVRSAPTQSSLVLYSSGGDCDTHPPGTHPPPESGGTVRVAFVDQHGQVSRISEPQPIQ